MAPGFCHFCVLPHLERTRHGTQGNEGCSGHVAIWHHCGECDSHRIESADCKKVLASLAAVATKEVKSTGKFTVPGLAMLKLKTKPATKAGKREMFGKVVVVKAKPAKKVVKCFAVAALKKSI